MNHPDLIEYRHRRAKELRKRTRAIRKELNLPYVPGSTLRFRRMVELPDGSISYVYFYEPVELKDTTYGLPHYILMDADTKKIRWAEHDEIFKIMLRELPEVVPCLKLD